MLNNLEEHVYERQEQRIFNIARIILVSTVSRSNLRKIV